MPSWRRAPLPSRCLTGAPDDKEKNHGRQVRYPAPAVEKTECANGHPRAEYWTTTKGGRSYCRACARAASKAKNAKNAKNAKPNPARLTLETIHSSTAGTDQISSAVHKRYPVIR